MKLELFNILADSKSTDLNSPIWMWVILLIILASPWVALLVYALTVKYRVRVFSNDHLISTVYLKSGQSIKDTVPLPSINGYEIEGLYLDPEFTEILSYDAMPKQNLKLYVKWIEVKSND